MSECEELILEILENHKRPITIQSLAKQIKKIDPMLNYEFRQDLTHLLAIGRIVMTLNRKLCLK